MRHRDFLQWEEAEWSVTDKGLLNEPLSQEVMEANFTGKCDGPKTKPQTIPKMAVVWGWY